ncbi:MAG: Fe-S cluster assembly protein SufD [Chitinophagaceae bacterium]
MNTIEYFKEQFDQLDTTDSLAPIRQRAFAGFSKMGIPTTRHEEWKYTRVGGFFNKDFQAAGAIASLTATDIDPLRLPGYEAANELVFVNGRFNAALSSIRSADLAVVPLEEAAQGEYKDIVSTHLGHSSAYLQDGINALNTAFMQGGVLVHVKKGKTIGHPVYIYTVTDARTGSILAQPRSLVYVGERSQLQLVETFATLGTQESFTNGVMEIVVEKDAEVGYYKIQNDGAATSLVSTTHFRQTGKSLVYAVTLSLGGGMVRNNTNVVMEAEYCEAHLYGLHFQKGSSHVDNHTVVDNVKPHCYSNELYKGILDDQASGVFNGKIFVRPDAQKTNAYQSNKNVLLSGTASINTKPQLEIFADDVKCSHGCTIGRLDEEGLFYMQSRGIPEKIAKSLLLHSFVVDILEKIKLEDVRSWADQLISERLELEQ